MNIHGKQDILILGFGREGKAAFDYLAKQRPGATFYVYDDKRLEESVRDLRVTILDNGLPLGEHARQHHFDLVVKSPGISLYRDDIRQLVSMGIEITSGTDIWLSTYGSKNTIAVTGTKGKSTTSSLIAFILQQLGYGVQLLGNLGVPLIDQLPGRDFTVLELSSYQTAGLQNPVDIAVFTNLQEEHIPWHGSVERYQADKLRLAGISPDTQTVFNADDTLLRQRFSQSALSHPASKSEITSDDGRIVFRGKTIGTNFRLKGEHNLLNLALALTTFETATQRAIDECIDFGSFDSLPHRLEEHLLDNGAIAVDDSLATTPDATLKALDVYRGKTIHLVLGGSDRGVDLTTIVDALPSRNLGSLVLTGPVGVRVFDQLPSSLKERTVLSTSLVQGLERMFGNVRSGEIVLLSPSATSFDEFRDYAEKGNAFVDACKRLASN